MINYSSIEEVLEKEKYMITGFEGCSMYPTFLKQDLLIFINSDSYNLYDVVLYKKNGKYIAHRIVDINDDCYVIRGDNTVTDEIVSKISVLAKIDSILRNKQEIKLDYNKNINDYKKSLKSLWYRRLKHKVKKILKYE